MGEGDPSEADAKSFRALRNRFVQLDRALEKALAANDLEAVRGGMSTFAWEVSQALSTTHKQPSHFAALLFEVFHYADQGKVHRLISGDATRQAWQNDPSRTGIWAAAAATLNYFKVELGEENVAKRICKCLEQAGFTTNRGTAPGHSALIKHAKELRNSAPIAANPDGNSDYMKRFALNLEIRHYQECHTQLSLVIPGEKTEASLSKAITWLDQLTRTNLSPKIA